MNVSALVTKEFQRIAADKRTLVLMFLIPALVLVIFGLSSGGGPTTLFTVNVITRDSQVTGPAVNASVHDETMIEAFQNSTVFVLRDGIYNMTDDASFDICLNQNKNKLKHDDIDAIIVIPANFSEAVENGTSDVTLIVYVDGSDAQVSEAIHVAIQEPVAYFRVYSGLTRNLTTVVPYLEFDVPYWANQVLNYAFPIVISMIMLGTCMNLTSLSIVSEAPLARMLLTPAGKTSVVFSKLVTATAIMFFQAAEIFTIAGLFGMFSRGPLILVFLSLLLIGMVGICIGIFISAVSKTEQVANQLYIMFFIMFTLFCQSFLPVDNFPPFLQAITAVFPLSNAIPLLSSIMYNGVVVDVASFFVLGATGLLFYVLALVAYAFKGVEA
ncbi:MAG: ABC transporter permease [Candidatus Lokiarchaeota archaeon]|nr:ABC transporter permease [Candidatus Lokiarchaeota archaeon]